MATTGHEQETINVAGLKASLQKFKTDIVDAGLTGKVDQTTYAQALQRIGDIEAVIGSATEADEDNIVNKVREMISFFATITEEKTLAGMLASLKTEIEGEAEHITYDSQTGKLRKTVGSETSDVTTIVTSGFSLTEDDESGLDTLTAIGSATITDDDANGLDVMTF